jgi:DNA polymerase-1
MTGRAENSAVKRLFLVDGANCFFRAYYAIRPLSTSRGLPTNALYGFAQMLLKLIRDERPDFIAVCFDTKEPTFRDGIYADYKANRKAPPDDLAEQFPYMPRIAEALGIAVLASPGFEADDIMGTLADRFSKEGVSVTLVSGDKDLMQLVGDCVSIYDGMKGLWIGPKQVEERFGVGPDRVADVLALAGDQSDNVPGVPGIGPKTASRLVAEYGPVEEVIARASEIRGAAGEKVARHADAARLAKRLVTIDRSVPLEADLEGLEYRGPDAEKVRGLFRELEFTRLLDELAPSSTISYDKHRLITRENDLKNVVNLIRNKKILSLDLETDSLDPMRARIVGFALCWDEGEAAYVPVGHTAKGGGVAEGGLFAGAELPAAGQLPMGKVLDALRPVLADGGIMKVGQNLNYDLTILRREGIEVAGVEFDTMIASYLLDPSAGHGLDAMASVHLGHRTIRYSDVAGKGKQEIPFAAVSLDAARDYACEDADVALRLRGIFMGGIEREGLAELFRDVEMPLVGVLVAMQIAGMKVDAARLEAIGGEFSAEQAGLEREIYSLTGAEFNIGSPRQLGGILFERLGLKGGRKTKTGYSTGQEVLEELAAGHELPRLVLRWRSLGKLRSTYAEALAGLVNPATGRVHTTFNQAVTATGRLSSSEPNLQNIPARTEEGRRIREAFVAEPGHLLVSADYSQIELRVLAHMSGEGALIRAFAEGQDVHAITASGIFGVAQKDVTRAQRDVGKTVNFATIYGQTAYGLSRQLGIEPGEAARYIENYFRRYPRVAAYRDEVLARARSEGRVTTLLGRRRFLPDILSSNGQQRQVAERMAFNTIFQGTAADIIKIAMIDVHDGLPEVSPGARMIMQVHDELVVEAPERDAGAVQAFLKGVMEGAVDLGVPLVVDTGVGGNWAEAH